MANKFIDITGQRFGEYIALDFEGYIGHSSMWLCQCDCGVLRFVRGDTLRRGKSRSCGCKKSEASRKARSLPFGVAAFNELYNSFIHSATSRKHEWKLSRERVKDITKKNCFYCGAAPFQERKASGGSYLYTGIDRLNSEGDYTENNVVPCCWKCNRAKNIMSVEEFISWINQAHKHLNGDRN